MSQLGGGDGARVGDRAAKAESKGQEARGGAARPGDSREVGIAEMQSSCRRCVDAC